jgi:hypothetical protein
LGAFFETEFLDRFVGDRRGYGLAAFKFDFDMRGGRTLVNFLDLAFEPIFSFQWDKDPFIADRLPHRCDETVSGEPVSRRREIYREVDQILGQVL